MKVIAGAVDTVSKSEICDGGGKPEGSDYCTVAIPFEGVEPSNKQGQISRQ